MHIVKSHTRSVGNVSKGERPTNYAQAGRIGNMLTKGCPCITGEMKYGKKSLQKTRKA
tara:strand:- start:1 stop:174 length:174 start_codon:yes stop_codon:yes gene_type:complete